MDDNVYYLVPKSDMDKYDVNTPLNIGGADPISIYSSVEAPKDTNHYRTNLINEKMYKSLESEGSPESILKIYNFLNGLYRTSINLDKTSTEEKNKNRQENTHEADTDYSIFMKSLPNVASKLAPGLIDYLKGNTRLVFETNGFIRDPNMGERVHIIDMLRTLLVNKTKVSEDVNTILQIFIKDLPKSYLKNKNIKVETQEDAAEWDEM